jgi:hypothetical protein
MARTLLQNHVLLLERIDLRLEVPGMLLLKQAISHIGLFACGYHRVVKASSPWRQLKRRVFLGD